MKYEENNFLLPKDLYLQQMRYAKYAFGKYVHSIVMHLPTLCCYTMAQNKVY